MRFFCFAGGAHRYGCRSDLENPQCCICKFFYRLVKKDLSLERQAKIFSALSDPTRLRIIEALRLADGEMTGTEITEKAKISGLALLCHHWKILEEAGLIVRRREGQSVYCSLNRVLLEQSVKSLAT